MESQLKTDEIEKLSGRERALLKKRHALHCKYAEALSLYADTELTLRKIAERCQLSAGGLGSYLRRYWSELVLRRHHIPVDGKDPKSIKIIAAGQQNPVAHAKYKDAVEACDTMRYIDLNVSQVARKFNLDGTALANFMRIHYAEILTQREEIRRRLGINDNIHHGVRKVCVEQYSEAVELYRSTDMTLPEVAALCRVSQSGLGQHLRFYHKDVMQAKRQVRRQAKETRKRIRGELLGNGRKYEPSPKTLQKYAKALALYRDTVLPVRTIVQQTGVPAEGFRAYLHTWHRELVLERLGIDATDAPKNLLKAKRKLKAVAVKYAAAIQSMKENLRPTAVVAAEFGFHPETFRDYLHKHEPELVRRLGMTRNRNGKQVSVQSEKKYGEAVRLYETTTESLKSIARRLGLTYNSVGGYVRRNYPEAIRHHQALLDKEKGNQ